MSDDVIKATQEQMKEEYLAHYGTKRHSGRYPWGSGDDPYQHEEGYPYEKPYSSPGDWLKDYDKLKAQGVKETEIANMFDFGSTSALRAAKRAATVKERNRERALAVKYQSEGDSLRTIAKKLGYKNDSSVRTLLNEETNQNKNKIFNIAERIKDEVDKHDIVDVGEGSEIGLGCSQETLEQALYILQAEYGYQIKGRRVEQMTNKGNFTTIRAAVKPDASKDILYNQSIDKHMVRIQDFGNNPNPNLANNDKPSFVKPTSLARNRLQIRYADQQGVERDGLIELRPGVKDLSLGDALYSQVRIVVDDDKGKPAYFLKGMAVYNKDLPEGIDVRFNTNKHSGLPDSEVLKKLEKIKDGEHKGEIDWENPFKSRIKDEGGQYYYIDDNGNEKLGLINKRADEGDWQSWSDALPAQFLAKQSPKFVKNQLLATLDGKVEELKEINNLTNPVVKQKMLKDFADNADSQAVHLKAAALPRQKYQVLMPVPSLKDNECFDTNFEDGEKLALIRFPHAGPFEIPILTVNNKNKEAIDMLGTTSKDAIGINSTNAARLSGADFDGDTVIAIPLSDKVYISSSPPLEGLRDFDGKASYPPKYKLDENGNKIYDSNGDPIIESTVMSKKALQNQMGQISNLITDMYLSGASNDELARAVKHSMVVVDSPKHKLDYQRSEIDNGIKELKNKYQKHDWYDWEGKLHKNATSAATIISLAKAQYTAPVHAGRPVIDKETGKIYYTKDGYKTAEYIDRKTGELVEKVKTVKSNWMTETENARDLVRDPYNQIEIAYADYANALKDLANQARKELVNTDNLKYNPEMAIKYADQVKYLNDELIKAQANRPREREAQLIAGILYQEYISNLTEELDKEDDKKLRDRLTKKARKIVGAQRYEINMTDEAWEAIQAGALSHTRVAKILERVNSADIKQRATPKERFTWTPAKENIANSMANLGWTTAQIAKRIGASVSEVSKFLSERR